jgi:hypothetical protein
MGFSSLDFVARPLAGGRSPVVRKNVIRPANQPIVRVRAYQVTMLHTNWFILLKARARSRGHAYVLVNARPSTRFVYGEPQEYLVGTVAFVNE